METKTKWTPTEIAADRAFHARRLADLTLDQATEALAPWLKKPWQTRANLSAYEAQRLPEKSGGRRRREFDTDLIWAMCQVYNVSPLWFFIPPNQAKEIAIGGTTVSPLELQPTLLLSLRDYHMNLLERGFDRQQATSVIRAWFQEIEAQMAQLERAQS